MTDFPVNTYSWSQVLFVKGTYTFCSRLYHAALVTGCVGRLHSLCYWKHLLWTQLRSCTQKSGWRMIFCVLGKARRHEWLFIPPPNRLIRVETALEQAGCLLARREPTLSEGRSLLEGGRVFFQVWKGNTPSPLQLSEFGEESSFPCGHHACLRGWRGPSTSTQMRVLLSGMTTY